MSTVQLQSSSTSDLWCPRCGAPLESGSKFCGECGQPITASTALRATLGLKSFTAPEADANAAVFPRRQSGPSLVNQQLESQAIMKTIGDLSFDLGVALAAAGRYTEAISSLESALKEKGRTSEAADILLHLGDTYEKAGRDERAFRSYLEAVQFSTGLLPTVLSRCNEILDAGLALAQGRWVTAEWAVSLKSQSLSRSDRAQALLFLGRVHLFLAEYPLALQRFEEATQEAPVQEWGSAIDLFSPESLPPALAAPSDGNSRYIVAQIYRVLGRPAEALQQVDQALQLGIKGENYPEAEAQQFKAELLLADGSLEQAALWLFEAGRRFNWRSEYLRAIPLLEEAIRLSPNQAHFYWFLMDSHRMLSALPDSPSVDAGRLNESLKAWEAGLKIAPPRDDYAWAYNSRAMVCDAQSFLFLDKTYSLFWEAAAYLECTLIFSEKDEQAEKDEKAEKDVDTRKYLSQHHRSLQLPATSLQEIGEAVVQAPNNPAALEEQIFCLLALGQTKILEEALQRREALEPFSPWVFIFRAYLALHANQFQECLAYLDRKGSDASTPAGSEIAVRWLRALAYDKLSDSESALKEYQWIWDQNTPSDRANQSIFGGAAYKLNHVEEAISIFESLREDPTETRGNAHQNLGLCYLAQGKWDLGEQNLAQGIEVTSNPLSLDDLRDIDLPYLEKTMSSALDNPIQPVLERLREQISRRRSRLIEQPITEEEELRTVLQQFDHQQQASHTVWIGAQAGLARLCLRKGDWQEAAAIYQSLLVEPDRFPAAPRALDSIIGKLQSRAVDLVRKHQPKEALGQYLRPALNLTYGLPGDNLKRQGDLLGRIGYAYFLSGEEGDAQKSFVESLQFYRKLGASEPGDLLATVCRSLLPHPTVYWDLRDLWERIRDSETDPVVSGEMGLAARSLDQFLDSWYGLSAQSGETAAAAPLVKPVIVDIGLGLLPQDASEDTPWVKTYGPEMRARIFHDMGVEAPGSILRDDLNALQPDEYRIMLDEIPVAWGKIQLQAAFSPTPSDQLTALGIPLEKLVAAPHPLTHQPGNWVASEFCERLTQQGLELWSDPLLYVIYHLEALLRWNLSSFIDTQTVDSLIRKRDVTGSEAALVQSILAEPASRVRLAAALRTLVEEGVPITRWNEILHAIQEVGLQKEDTAKLVCAMRVRLKDQLPGNETDTRRLLLPAGLETKMATGVCTGNGKTYFALPQATLQEITEEITLLAQSQQGKFALVTRSKIVRPLARILVSMQLPFVMVLSKEEALDPVEVISDVKNFNRLEEIENPSTEAIDA